MPSAIRSARRLVPSEAQLKKAVCDWLDAKRIRYHRLNAGAIVAGDGRSRRFIRMGAPGTPDLLILLPVTMISHAGENVDFIRQVWPAPVPAYIELKCPGKHPGLSQREWHERARREGLEVHVCHSVEEVAAALEGFGGRA